MSFVWKSFEKSKDDAKCKVCGVRMKYTGGSTSSLKRHLERKHDIIEKQPKLDSSKAVSQSATSLTLEECFSKKIKYNTDNQRQISITKLILELITEDLLPFSIVEGTAFTKLLGFLDPKFLMPSRKSIRNKWLPDAYESQKKILETKIKTYSSSDGDGVEFTPCFSLTTDGWTSRARMSFVTYTLHFINKDFEMESYSLSTTVLPTAHTAVNLQRDIAQICHYWKLVTISDCAVNEAVETDDSDEEADLYETDIEEASCTHSPLPEPETVSQGSDVSFDNVYDAIKASSRSIYISTDNATNYVRACELLGVTRIPCFAHTINLAVQKGLTSTTVQNNIARVRQITAYFHKSAIATTTLKVSHSLLADSTSCYDNLSEFLVYPITHAEFLYY